MSIAAATRGNRVAWIVPTYRNGRSLWRWAMNATGPARQAKLVKANQAERLMEFPGGGTFGIYSADNEDSVRGESFHLVVLDEAARISETAWTDAIQPTLADVDGQAILISTPKGRNWFYTEFLRGMGDMQRQASFTAPSAANPIPSIRAAAAKARSLVSERTYRQEWLAEFVEDGGEVFRRVDDAVDDSVRQSEGRLNTQYVMGVDWGRTNDATVLTVVDVTTGAAVYLDRMTQTDYELQIGRLWAAFYRFHPSSVVAELNSMGGPLVERLQSQGLPVTGFTTTNATKASIIDGLALAFEQHTLRILSDPVLVSELKAYTSERLPSGLTRYGAPAGMHDDAVMSLALAWHGAGKSLTGDLFV